MRRPKLPVSNVGSLIRAHEPLAVLFSATHGRSYLVHISHVHLSAYPWAVPGSSVYDLAQVGQMQWLTVHTNTSLHRGTFPEFSSRSGLGLPCLMKDKYRHVSTVLSKLFNVLITSQGLYSHPLSLSGLLLAPHELPPPPPCAALSCTSYTTASNAHIYVSY